MGVRVQVFAAASAAALAAAASPAAAQSYNWAPQTTDTGAISDFDSATQTFAGTYADTLTFDAMNRVVAAGMINEGGDARFAVARFTSAGALDTTFGGTGIVTLNVAPGGGPDETARSVVIQSDGKIVVAGMADH